MKYGIYYAYWAREWGGDFLPFISKVKRLGFDVLEVNCGSFPERDDSYFRELRRVSEGEGVLLSGGYGPRPEHNLSSADPALIEGAFRFWADVFHKMELSGIDRVGGALYSMASTRLRIPNAALKISGSSPASRPYTELPSIWRCSIDLKAICSTSAKRRFAMSRRLANQT